LKKKNAPRNSRRQRKTKTLIKVEALDTF
jgi:hypothetical protein